MSTDSVHVAVAIIKNHRDEVLISLRPEHVHQGGCWEFPGGKVEKGESVQDALKREIYEELSLVVTTATPYKIIKHQYSDKHVTLDIWLVDSFSGEEKSAEGQKIKWCAIKNLDPADFPEANKNIVNALKLPDKFMITGNFNDEGDFLNRLEISLINGIRLVQLRCKKCSTDELRMLSKKASRLCCSYGARLLVNTSSEIFESLEVDGLHLTSHELQQYNTRPVSESFILSVSCHTADDIARAQLLKADFILLSPVKETSSHPGVPGIGWEQFSTMIMSTDMPVYALGGMSINDLSDANKHGAQGIAAISSLWASDT